MNRYSPIFNIYTLNVYNTDSPSSNLSVLFSVSRLNAIVFIDSTIIINRTLLFLDVFFRKDKEIKFRSNFVIFIFRERIIRSNDKIEEQRIDKSILEIFCGKNSENFNGIESRNLLEVNLYE